MVEVSPHSQQDDHPAGVHGSGIEQVLDKTLALGFVVAECKQFLKLVDHQQ